MLGVVPATAVNAPDAGHGAFVVLSHHYFEAGGSLDYKSFLFGEEIFLAESCRDLGLSVLYDDSLTVIHQEHASRDLLKSRQTARLEGESSALNSTRYFARENS